MYRADAPWRHDLIRLPATNSLICSGDVAARLDENAWRSAAGANDPTIFEKCRVLDPAPRKKMVETMLNNVRTTFPQLAGLELDHAWGAYIDSTPDAVPVISKTDVDGLVIAAGSSGHGFGLGPGIATLAVDLATNAEPCVDPAPFRLSRFEDGSKIEVGSL